MNFNTVLVATAGTSLKQQMITVRQLELYCQRMFGRAEGVVGRVGERNRERGRAAREDGEGQGRESTDVVG